MNMNFFTGIFKGFCLLFRSTDSKEHLFEWQLPFIFIGSNYFLGKFYSRDYLNVKLPHSKLF